MESATLFGADVNLVLDGIQDIGILTLSSDFRRPGGYNEQVTLEAGQGCLAIYF